MRLILASASPARLELLRNSNIFPDKVIPADVDETPNINEKPAIYVKRIAKEKAIKIFKDYKDYVVLAADTIAVIDSKIIGKAENSVEARKIIKQLQGRKHQVLTAVCVVSEKNLKCKVFKSDITFKSMNENDIAWYISTNDWVGKSGCFTLMGKASCFIESIKGSHTNIIGLPMPQAIEMLIESGFKPRSLCPID